MHLYSWEVNRVFETYYIFCERATDRGSLIFKTNLDQMLAYEKFCVVQLFVVPLFATESYRDRKLATSCSEYLL